MQPLRCPDVSGMGVRIRPKYADYPSAKKMIEDDRIVSYIIKQIKISLKIPILEVLLLKVADDGTIFFEE
jgi:hypothetical protein